MPPRGAAGAWLVELLVSGQTKAGERAAGVDPVMLGHAYATSGFAAQLLTRGARAIAIAPTQL
jgi:hypothetical protein